MGSKVVQSTALMSIRVKNDFTIKYILQNEYLNIMIKIAYFYGQMLVGLIYIKLTGRFRKKYSCKYIANFSLTISSGEVEAGLPN